MAQMWVDPPGGWRYGFPKKIPDGVINQREWMIAEGYPKEVMDSYGDSFFCRYWYDVVDGSAMEKKDGV